MPRNKDIKKVLVIGSGPIVIGQAAEFDYAGTQACRSLKEEGVEVCLVNSNPATIMTDKQIADQVFQMIAVCIHGIQPVIVIRIGKINGSVFLTKQAGIVKVSGSISVDIACVVFDLTFLMAVKAQSCKYYDQNSNYNYGQTFFHNIESSLVSCILPFIPLCYKILS